MRQLIFLVLIGIFSLSHCFAQQTAVEKNWYELLPHCPCMNPDLDSIHPHDGWAREKHRSEMSWLKKLIIGKKDFTLFHPGASESFRSYPYVRTIIDGKRHHSGQQCTYDEKGNLIKGGAAAGTPDKVSAAKGENKKGILRVNIFRVYTHLRCDANPWKDAGWEKYNKFWPPDQGVGCSNSVSP